MNWPKISLLIAFITFTFSGTLTFAADMGGQLKLKDDSKQELKEVMKQIKKIATYKYEYTPKKNTDKHWNGEQTFDFSGCNVKSHDNTWIDDYKCVHIHEYSLNDIETAEISMYSDIGANKYIKIKTKEFDKKVFTTMGCINSSVEEKYSDSGFFTVPDRNATAVIDLLEKAIKLCADR